MKRVIICLVLVLLGATVVQAQSLDENDILKSLTQGKTLPTPPTEEELYGPDEEVVKAESATNVEVPKAVEPKAEENVMPKLDSMLCVWSEQNRFMACEEILNPQILADTIDLPASDIPDSV